MSPKLAPCLDKTDVTKAYRIAGRIGQGATAYVQRAVRLADGKAMALKRTRADDPATIANARREYEILRSVDHPSIAQASELLVLPHEVILVLGLFEGANIWRALKPSPRGLPEHKVRPLANQLVGAVAHLHEHGIVHCDIKPENVLVSRTCSCLMLIDFNSACRFDDAIQFSSGTALYMAPEWLCGETATTGAIDVWGAGLCLYLLLTGVLPQGRGAQLSSEELTQLATQLVCFEGETFDHVTGTCKDALRQMLAIAPGSRPAASQLLQSPWVHEH